MKNILITFALLLLVLRSFGQPNQNEKMKHMMDSIKAKRLDALAWKNPMLRQAGVSTEVLAPGKITSDLRGNSFLKGKYQTMRTNVYFNVPIIQYKKNIFSAGIGATHQSMQLYDVTSYESSMSVKARDVDNTLLRTSFTYTRLDSLFHRPVVYSATATGLLNPETSQYLLTYNAAVILSVIQTKTSNLSVGLLALRDPTSPLPLIPFISYYHKFKSPGLEFFFDPSRIALRKELSPRRSIAFSNNVDRNLLLYEQHDAASLPRQHTFIMLEMKSGITYEYLLTKKLVFSINGGVSNTLKSAVFEHNKFSDPFIKNKQSMVPYVKVSVSFLPFWRGIFQ